MPSLDGTNDIVRFGTFELHWARGELRKRGVRVRLEGQPLQILMMLIERRGAPVSREELQEALWPNLSSGDFERNLNSAVKRLRAVLNDPGHAPRYIERLRKRGYRLIVPVTLVQGGMTLLAPAAPSEQAPGPSPEVFSIRPSAPAAFGFRWQRVAIAVLLAAVVGAGSYFYGRSSTERARDALRSIAVLPFATGGPNSGEGTDYIAFSLTEAVTYELAQLDGFRVASTASVRGSRESGKSLAEIAKLLGVGAVLDGSIIQDGSRVVVTVQLVEAAADERLWTGGYTRDSMSLTTQKEIAQHICRHVWQTLVPIGKAMVLQQPAGLTAYSRATVR